MANISLCYVLLVDPGLLESDLPNLSLDEESTYSSITLDTLPRFEITEETELQQFSDILKNVTTMTVKDTIDKVQRHHIERYREQVTILQEEHQAELWYLERQIELEQSRNREGTAIQQSLSNKLQQNRAELKEQAKTLQQLQKNYQIKREEVADLRERLHDSEKELGKVRNNLTEQKEKMSEMLPVAPSQAHRQMMTDMTKTSQLLDSILRLMPDEKMIKEELERRQWLKQCPPVTTSLLLKTPELSSMPQQRVAESIDSEDSEIKKIILTPLC